MGIESESEAKTTCEGKPYFLITKTKNFEQCKKTPFFQMITRDSIATADISKPNELLSVMSSTNIYVCGELNEFTVRKISHKRVAESSLTGYNTLEKSTAPSMVTMSLLKVKSISARLNVPNTTRVVRSLVFEFPRVEGRLAGEPTQEVTERTEELLGMRPILPMPTLTQAPHNIVIDLNKEEIMPKIHEQIKKMARIIYESPESCASKSDLAGTVNSLALYMRSLSLSELEQLESQIVRESHSSGMKSMEKIFYDVLSLVGTNPSTMLIVKKVQEGSLPVSLLTKLVTVSIRNIRYPTQEMLEKLVEMIQSSTVKSNKQLYTSSMLQLSNLFYHGYVNPSTMVNNFPVKVFGVFGTKESHVLTEKFIPFLVEEIERTESEHVRLSAILALGKMNPTEIRPILMSIIVNPVESAEVRIAAISILPFALPTTTEIQKLAIRSWMEPSKQVSYFIVSTIRSLASTQVPELKVVGLKARSVLPLIKDEQYGLQHSHNINYSSFVDYLKVLVSNQYQLINSKESLIPHKMALKTVYYAPSNIHKVKAIEFSAYTYGMDYLLEKYLHFFSTEEQTTTPIKKQLNKIAEEMKLKTRELPTPFSFVHGNWAGMEASLYLDTEIVLDTLEKLTTKFEKGHDVEFNHVGAHQIFDASYMFVTETGFPILATSTLPIIYSVKGSVKVSPMEGRMVPRVLGKIVPVLNGKLQTHYGIISPFTKEFVGTGVEMSVHASLPIEIEGKMTQGQIELSIRVPTEVERSGLTPKMHGFIKPYTFKYNLLTVTPLSHATQLKRIVSGINRQPISMEVGESLGVSARIQYQSDAKFVDMFSYIQKIIQHTPLSVFPSGIFPSSARMSSLSLEYFPAKSQTKEINFVVRLSTKGMLHSLSQKQISEGQISSQFRQVKFVLSKLEKANVVEIIGMTKSASGSELKKIQTVVVLGQKPSGVTGHEWNGDYNCLPLSL